MATLQSFTSIIHNYIYRSNCLHLFKVKKIQLESGGEGRYSNFYLYGMIKIFTLLFYKYKEIMQWISKKKNI
jgi:hypothetical protein